MMDIMLFLLELLKCFIGEQLGNVNLQENDFDFKVQLELFYIYEIDIFTSIGKLLDRE